MKLHERSVHPYCHGASPVDKEGYLNKKGELNTSYQRRWFVLKGNLLFYFERRGERDPLGLIVLEGCSVELCESDEEFAFALVYSDPGLRMYKMAAESQASLEAWIKVLLAASYDYLKMLVGDLKGQYEELCLLSGKAALPGIALLSPASCLWGPQGDGAVKSNMGHMGGGVQAKPPKRSPKMWAKRVHPAPCGVRQESPGELVGAGTAASFPRGKEIDLEDFALLHRVFGEEVVLLRRAWQEKHAGPDIADGKDEDLIDLGQ
ncbi:sesquipedalian-1-like [Pleurodeles waltl]